jgi:hypothetical protein
VGSEGLNETNGEVRSYYPDCLVNGLHYQEHVFDNREEAGGAYSDNGTTEDPNGNIDDSELIDNMTVVSHSEGGEAIGDEDDSQGDCEPNFLIDANYPEYGEEGEEGEPDPDDIDIDMERHSPDAEGDGESSPFPLPASITSELSHTNISSLRRGARGCSE